MAVGRYDLVGDSDVLVDAAERAERAIREVGREGDKTKRKVKDLGKQTDRGAKSFEAVKEAAEGFGGVLGENAGRVEKFGKSMSAAGAALGPVGLAAGAATLAVAGLGFAAFKVGEQMLALVRAVEAALPNLEQLEEFAIPAETLEGVRATVDAVNALGGVFSRLGALIVGEFGPKVVPVIEAFIGLVITGGQKAVRAVVGMLEAWDRFIHVINPVAALTRTVTENIIETVKASDAWRGLRDVGAGFVAEWKSVNETVKKTSDSLAAVVITRDELAALMIAEIENFETVITMQELYALNVQMIAEAEAAAATAKAKADRDAIERERTLLALRDEQIANVGDFGSALSTVAANSNAAMDQERERLEVLAELEGAQNKMVRKQAKERLKLLDEQQRKQEQVALAGFFAEQAAAVSAIAINTAVAITRALAELGPVAGAVAATAIGITGGTQLAAVLSTPAPTFHDGGRHSDERVGILRGGESTLNQRATETTDVDRLNRGQPSEPQRWVLEDAGRVIGEVVLRALERPGDMRARYRSALGVA